MNDKADAYALARHFRIALGLSASKFQRSKQARSDDIKLADTCRRILPKSELLREIGRVRESNAGFQRERDLTAIVLRVFLEENGKKSRKSALTTTTPPAALESFERQMTLIEPVLNFDTCTFALTYMRKLFRISEKHGDPLRRTARSWRGPDGLERLPWDFVDGLLWEAADAVHKAKAETQAGMKEAVRRTTLARAIDGLDKTVIQPRG